MRLLLVEDDQMLSNSLLHQLEKSGFSVDPGVYGKRSNNSG